MKLGFVGPKVTVEGVSSASAEEDIGIVPILVEEEGTATTGSPSTSMMEDSPDVSTSPSMSRKSLAEEEEERELCEDPFFQCLHLPNVKKTHGAQGQVWIGCPTPFLVRKTFPFKTFRSFYRPKRSKMQLTEDERRKEEEWARMEEQKLLDRFFKICTELTPAINAAAKDNPVLLQTPVCRILGCGLKGQDPKLILDQERADGVNLREHVQQLDSIWPTLTSANRFLAKKALFYVILQVISAVDTLYRRRLYHNDLHAENILLRRLTAPIALPIGLSKIYFEPMSSPYFAAVIDYGLVTRDVPLDRNYKLSNSVGMPPLLDLCQLYNSLIYVPTHNIKRQELFEDLDRLLGDVCQAGLDMTRASAILQIEVGRLEEPIDLKMADSIYSKIIQRAQTLAPKPFTPKPPPPPPIKLSSADVKTPPMPFFRYPLPSIAYPTAAASIQGGTAPGRCVYGTTPGRYVYPPTSILGGRASGRCVYPPTSILGGRASGRCVYPPTSILGGRASGRCVYPERAQEMRPMMGCPGALFRNRMRAGGGWLVSTKNCECGEACFIPFDRDKSDMDCVIACQRQGHQISGVSRAVRSPLVSLKPCPDI